MIFPPKLHYVLLTFRSSLSNSPIFTPEDIIQVMYLESFPEGEMMGESRGGSVFLFGIASYIYKYMIEGHDMTPMSLLILFFFTFSFTIVKLS